MFRFIRPITRIAGAALVAATPAFAQGTKDIASCKTVLDANAKLYKTPNHMYMQESVGARGVARSTAELVRVGGATYFQVKGQWRRSPMTPEAAQEQEKENIENAKALSCHRLGEESGKGGPASVFSQHSETEGVTSDGKIWVDNQTGLIVREELDTDVGEVGGKTHRSVRYEYTNVKPPIAAP